MSSHSQKPPADRLLKLNEQVSRIATSLAQLSQVPPEQVATSGHAPEVRAELVDAVIHRRRERAAYLPLDLLGDPAWDMMLELLRAEVMQHSISISTVCAAAGVPETAALRWLRGLEERGLVNRRSDQQDQQREFVELTRDGSSAMRRWFADSFGGVDVNDTD